MQNSQKESNQKKVSQRKEIAYDYAIIGSGLTGLCIANALSKVSKQVVLIEAGDTYGGLNRAIQSKVGPINNGIRFLPDTELARKALDFLEPLLATPLTTESLEAPPVTYESGDFKSFLGFGDHPPAFYEEISYFTTPNRLRPALEPHEWSQVLFNNYTGQFLPRSYVTEFHSDNGKVVSISVNGQKTIQAHNFIFAGSVSDLKVLLPEGTLNSKTLQKLSRNPFWTAVCLDSIHQGEVTDRESIHILNGTSEDEVGPCAGYFHPADKIEEQTVQCSQWISFVENEDSEDSEKVGLALKKIKRQIKRAYPQALENIQFERILVVPHFSGNGDLKLSGRGTLPNLENLWIASPTMNSQRNLVGALLQAEFICSALGVDPRVQEIPSPTEATAEGEFSSMEPEALA